MSDASLRGDCGRCAALCCLLLGFERGPHFAFGKPAAVACRHLDRDDRCAIHHRLAARGMSGCAAYDCRGAGQLVTAMFAGLDWRADPAIARAMATAFALLSEIQLLRIVLAQAPATPPRDALAASLASTEGWTYARLLALDLGAVRTSLRNLLRAAA